MEEVEQPLECLLPARTSRLLGAGANVRLLAQLGQSEILRQGDSWPI
jgi:hypothetical protein